MKTLNSIRLILFASIIIFAALHEFASISSGLDGGLQNDEQFHNPIHLSADSLANDFVSIPFD